MHRGGGEGLTRGPTGTLPTGPDQPARPGTGARSRPDHGDNSSGRTMVASPPLPLVLLHPHQLRMGALNLLGAGSWKSRPSKEGNSQPSFFGEIPHQPRQQLFSFSLFRIIIFF